MITDYKSLTIQQLEKVELYRRDAQQGRPLSSEAQDLLKSTKGISSTELRKLIELKRINWATEFNRLQSNPNVTYNCPKRNSPYTASEQRIYNGLTSIQKQEFNRQKQKHPNWNFQMLMAMLAFQEKADNYVINY